MPLARGLRAAVLGVACALAAPARAEVTVAAGLEQLTWEEDIEPAVSERGTLRTFSIGARQEREAGWLLAYQGKFYAGETEYRGATLAPPVVEVTGTTHYDGMAHEVQLRFRVVERGREVDVLGGAGWEQWRRRLSSVQVEDYRVGYLRLGADVGAQDVGGFAGAGVKYPYSIDEDAHLDAIGFGRNTPLKPGPELSFYARVGYRFGRILSVTAYADGYRFKQSPAVPNVSPTGGSVVIFQPASRLRIVGLALEASLR